MVSSTARIAIHYELGTSLEAEAQDCPPWAHYTGQKHIIKSSWNYKKNWEKGMTFCNDIFVCIVEITSPRDKCAYQWEYASLLYVIRKGVGSITMYYVYTCFNSCAYWIDTLGFWWSSENKIQKYFFFTHTIFQRNQKLHLLDFN